MARLTKITTRTGDDGTTMLGSGRRVPKDDPQVEAYGDVDELNSLLGVVLSRGPEPAVAEVLARVQSELLHLGGVLAMLDPEGTKKAPNLVKNRHVNRLGREVERFNADLGPLETFILPAGAETAALLHLARTVCRRAERRVVALGRERSLPPTLVRYLNRLSDLLFVLARWENRARGVGDVPWDTEA